MIASRAAIDQLLFLRNASSVIGRQHRLAAVVGAAVTSNIHCITVRNKSTPVEGVQVEHGRGAWKTYGDLSNYKQGNYQIKTFNKISPVGLARFPSDEYDIREESQPAANAHAILLRSHKLKEEEVPKTVRAIARYVRPREIDDDFVFYFTFHRTSAFWFYFRLKLYIFFFFVSFLCCKDVVLVQTIFLLLE